ncbi:MAG: hypothetical protein KC646_10295 [Candidatus Cloacimonetes bacterium]|nr:hypothetical protein [Candidatus Cloacimonadota bacterium]
MQNQIWNPNPALDSYDSDLIEFIAEQQKYALRNTRLWEKGHFYYPFANESTKLVDIIKGNNLARHTSYGPGVILQSVETVNSQIQTVANNANESKYIIPSGLYPEQPKKSTFAFNAYIEAGCLDGGYLIQINEANSLGHYVNPSGSRFVNGFGYNNLANYYSSYTVPTPGWHHYVCSIEWLDNNDVISTIHRDGVIVFSIVYSGYTPSRMSTAHGNSLFATSYFGGSSFGYSANNIYHATEIFTQEEILDLYNKSGIVHHLPNTSPKITPGIYLLDDPDLEEVISISPDVIGSGSVGYRQNDGSNSLFFNGSEWDNQDTLQNSLNVMNENLSSLLLPNQKWKPELFLNSDGYQEPSIGQITVSYNLNEPPTVHAGANKPISGELKVGDSLLIFSDASISDDVAVLYYQIDGGQPIYIKKELYATLQEALNNLIFDTSGLSGGSHNITLTGIDDFNDQLVVPSSTTLTLVDGLIEKIDGLATLVNDLNQNIISDQFVEPDGTIIRKNSLGQTLARYVTTRGTVFENPKAVTSIVRIIE